MPPERVSNRGVVSAAGASDVIANATTVSTLEDALKGCSLVLGSSARCRTLPWPMLDPHECATLSVRSAEHRTVALVFGRERTGLTNQELQLCHYHVSIPAHPDYSSLNIAMAVQILAYEIRVAFLRQQQQALTDHPEKTAYPLFDEMERFYAQLEQVLSHTGFIRQTHPGQIMSKLRRLFTRARPESQELHILRGILASFEKRGK